MLGAYKLVSRTMPDAASPQLLTRHVGQAVHHVLTYFVASVTAPQGPLPRTLINKLATLHTLASGGHALSPLYHNAHAGRREAHVGRRASCAARLEPSLDARTRLCRLYTGPRPVLMRRCPCLLQR